MTRMPDFEHALGDIEGFAQRVLHHDAAEVAGDHPYFACAITIPAPTETATTPEEPVNIVFDLEQDARNLAAKFATVDHDALGMLDAVQNDPELMDLFKVVASLAGVPATLPAGLLSSITAALKALAPAQAPVAS